MDIFLEQINRKAQENRRSQKGSLNHHQYGHTSQYAQQNQQPYFDQRYPPYEYQQSRHHSAKKPYYHHQNEAYNQTYKYDRNQEQQQYGGKLGVNFHPQNIKTNYGNNQQNNYDNGNYYQDREEHHNDHLNYHNTDYEGHGQQYKTNNNINYNANSCYPSQENYQSYPSSTRNHHNADNQAQFNHYSQNQPNHQNSYIHTGHYTNQTQHYRQETANNQLSHKDQVKAPPRKINDHELLQILSKRRKMKIQNHPHLKLPGGLCVSYKVHSYILGDQSEKIEIIDMGLIISIRGERKKAIDGKLLLSVFYDLPEFQTNRQVDKVKGFKQVSGFTFQQFEHLGSQLTEEILNNFSRYFS